jgi:alcohol dehydrogenase (cytochrome c)
VGRTVGELFFVMSTLMPEGNPGSLSPEEYANIVSYMLSENGYPAGEVDLAADQPTLASIRIEAADR